MEDEEESKSRKRKRVRRAEVNEDEVAKAIRETLADSGDELAIARAAIRRKKKEKREEEEQKKLDQLEHDKMRIKVTEYVTVGELANLMQVTVAEVIQKVMGLGIMVSINQRLDKDTITLVSDEFGFQVTLKKNFLRKRFRTLKMMKKHFFREHLSSRLWDMSITVKHHCLIIFEMQMSLLVKREE